MNWTNWIVIYTEYIHGAFFDLIVTKTKLIFLLFLVEIKEKMQFIHMCL